MRTVFCLCLVLTLTGFLHAGEAGFPPGITRESAAQGWIALYDGETNYGWKATGSIGIKNNVLTIGGEKEASLTTTTAFHAFDLVMNYQAVGTDVGFSLNAGDSAAAVAESSQEFKDFKFGTPDAKRSGPITITTKPGTTLHIKSIILKPLGAKPIFNGKDLTGWKEIPGRKSKFSVTSAGEINVKDGNGDLQTIDQWDDFVLQLDVISNGDHLNSGVFFRCLPGEFWSGYEAQVRNEWQTTVKLKDGKSHTGSLTPKGDGYELKAGRQTIKFKKDEAESIVDHRNKPIDFGSGGIYNFCPSRKVVSTDREYYTMTVVAHGNHFAVWVNGYMTAEHTDTRAVNNNARRGRKDNKGTFSIQGHDPTTDLSFKNLRVATLPK
jgi:hypothetical protein